MITNISLGCISMCPAVKHLLLLCFFEAWENIKVLQADRTLNN